MSDEIAVDGQTLGFGAYKIYLSNKTSIQVSGPSAVDVRDGALLILDISGKAQMALAPGQWLSVNVAPA